eukprot:TRINITY_DN34948_c0_g1_i1.p2 TRINITY_DN34948_c0_g1~~TRINITY_DN34948_c0_g1_i1.p2  ORF type:complete len:112 (+),score=21.12 TRINITY_DN34948_c0_g1_i1:154-489(+)
MRNRGPLRCGTQEQIIPQTTLSPASSPAPARASSPSSSPCKQRGPPSAEADGEQSSLRKAAYKAESLSVSPARRSPPSMQARRPSPQREKSSAAKRSQASSCSRGCARPQP